MNVTLKVRGINIARTLEWRPYNLKITTVHYVPSQEETGRYVDNIELMDIWGSVFILHVTWFVLLFENILVYWISWPQGGSNQQIGKRKKLDRLNKTILTRYLRTKCYKYYMNTYLNLYIITYMHLYITCCSTFLNTYSETAATRPNKTINHNLQIQYKQLKSRYEINQLFYLTHIISCFKDFFVSLLPLL